MVLDSSAIVALVLNEPESPRLRATLETDQVALMGAPSVLESAMVLTRFLGAEGRRNVIELLTAPFTSE